MIVLQDNHFNFKTNILNILILSLVISAFDIGFSNDYYNPQISNTGDVVVYVMFNGNSNEIFKMDIKSKKSYKISCEKVASFKVLDTYWPMMTPDGHFVVYDAQIDTVPKSYVIIRYDCLTGQNIIVSEYNGIMGKDCRKPSVSDDGNIIAYVADVSSYDIKKLAQEDIGGPTVFYRNIMLNTVDMLNEPYGYCPTVSSDGKNIAFIQFGKENHYAIYNIESKKTELISGDDIHPDSRPLFDNDMKYVVYAALQNIDITSNPSTVFFYDILQKRTMHVDNQLTKNTRVSLGNSGVEISADGRYLIYQKIIPLNAKRNDVFLCRYTILNGREELLLKMNNIEKYKSGYPFFSINNDGSIVVLNKINNNDIFIYNIKDKHMIQLTR
jgi:hypothetical protein